MRYRIFTVMILSFLFLPSTSSAVTNDEAVSAVMACYRITKPGFLGGFNEIGSILRPRREGLRANRPSSVFKPNVVNNNMLVTSGGGDLPLGGVHDGALRASERLHLYGVRTGKDYLQLELYTVATYVVPGSGTRGPTPLQASIRFQFDAGLSGVTTQQLIESIGVWLAAEGESCTAAGGSRTPAEFRPAAVPAEQQAGRATSTIRIGQTPEEVTAILGPPEKQILLGAKTIFVYRDVKIVFVDGKVSDAE